MKSIKSKSSLSRTTAQNPEPAGLQDQIRLRAHELYESRGRQDGQALDDWLQAEAELTKGKAKAAHAL
jgi:Protein of unknown function (DUF2934)